MTTRWHRSSDHDGTENFPRPATGRATAAVILLAVACACGCAPERPKSVPPEAKSVARQSGSSPVHMMAPDDGTAYVFDRTEQKMVYSGRLKRGETLEVDPKGNGVRIDGKKVVEAKLRDLNEYQVWFDAEKASTAGARATTRPSE